MRVMRSTLVLFVLLVAGCSYPAEEPATTYDVSTLSSGLPTDAAAPPAIAPRPEMGEEAAKAQRATGSVPGRGGVVGNISAAAFTGRGQGGPRATGPGGSQGSSTADAMIIRTGQAAIEVDSLEPAVANIQALALQVGGYVANIAMHTGRAQLRQATLEVKIPAARFDDALEGLQPIGKLERLEVAAQDVGEEYADIAARVSNARRLEERLLSLLATRTGRLDDVLAAERELARVREEIERYEGRMRYLEARSILSTLHVTVHEPAPILGRNASNPIVDAFRGAWRNFVAMLAGLIELSGFLIPIAAIGLGGWIAWRRWGPRMKEAGEGTA